MCVSPISITNPNLGRTDKYAFLFDTTSARISVPCGHCDECIANRQMSLVQRVIMESTENHLFFSTLTYSNRMLPVMDVNGRHIRYAKYQDLNSVIRRIRRNNLFPRSFRYFAVSELGSKHGRPHFHCLWLLPKEPGDDFNTCLSLEQQMRKILLESWCRNVGSRKYPLYVPLCDYVRKFIRGKWRSNYDFHYVNPAYSEAGVADVGFYVLKYMLKPSDRATRLQQALHLNLDEEDYKRVWSIVKPRYFKSQDFGLSSSEKVRSHLRRGISLFRDDYDFPVFLNPINGTTMPLSRFYRNKGDIFDIDSATYFAMNREEHYRDLSFTDYRKHSLRKNFLEEVSDIDSFDESLC